MPRQARVKPEWGIGYDWGLGVRKNTPEGWAKSRGRIRTGGGQEGGHQTDRAEELQGQIVMEDNARARAG